MENYRTWLIVAVVAVLAWFLLRPSGSRAASPTVISSGDAGLSEKDRLNAWADLFKSAIGYDLSIRQMDSQERMQVASGLYASQSAASQTAAQLEQLRLAAAAQQAQISQQTAARLAEIQAQQKLYSQQNKGNIWGSIIGAAGNVLTGIFGNKGGGGGFGGFGGGGGGGGGGRRGR